MKNTLPSTSNRKAAPRPKRVNLRECPVGSRVRFLHAKGPQMGLCEIIARAETEIVIVTRWKTTHRIQQNPPVFLVSTD